MKQTTTSGSRLDRIDTFVVAGVVTVLGTRGFLALTGYPELGNNSLHVAHVLWGGLMLMVAFLLLLLSNKPNKLLSALLGGIGFGLFIDEVGKFITQDNDYFYEPAVAVIYVVFLLIWLITRLLIVRLEKASFFSPAEWPERQWMRVMIIFWSATQVAIGVITVMMLAVFGINDLSEFLDITKLGIFISVLYAGFLSFGLYRYYRREFLRAAHDLRGATLFGIVALYPFLYFNYPLEATIGITATLFVAIGLSEVSVMSLIKKLLIKQ